MARNFARGLYARINNGGVFAWERVEIRRQNPVPVPNTTSYFLRYMQDGKRTIVPLGRDLTEAFIHWRNHDSDRERLAMGKAPIHHDTTADTPPARRTIADAVQAFLADNADKLARSRSLAKSRSMCSPLRCRRAQKACEESLQARSYDVCPWMGVP